MSSLSLENVKCLLLFAIKRGWIKQQWAACSKYQLTVFNHCPGGTTAERRSVNRLRIANTRRNGQFVQVSHVYTGGLTCLGIVVRPPVVYNCNVAPRLHCTGSNDIFPRSVTGREESAPAQFSREKAPKQGRCSPPQALLLAYIIYRSLPICLQANTAANAAVRTSESCSSRGESCAEPADGLRRVTSSRRDSQKEGGREATTADPEVFVAPLTCGQDF